jgi:hypothetical protein
MTKGSPKRNSLVADARTFQPGWRVWMGLLVVVNLVAPLFFLAHPVAWAVLGCYLVSAVVILSLHRRLGWVRLLGVGHFPWLVLLPWVWFHLRSGEPTGAQALWLGAVLLVDAVCLAIDAVDAARYLAGERAPIAPR